MYTWIAAGIAGLLTAVAAIKLPFRETGGHDFCSYLSLTLPLLGLMALKERPRWRSINELEEHRSASPQPVDIEHAASIIQKIAAESASELKPTLAQPAPPPLSGLEFLWALLADPRRAFEELSRRACAELIGTTLIILLLQATVNGSPHISFGRNFLFLSVFFLLYALGRAGLLMVSCRWFSCQISVRTAVQGVLANEVVYAILLAALLLVPPLQGTSGPVPFIRLGLGTWIQPLGTTHPVLFNYLAQVNVFTVWGFCLWWAGLASLTKLAAQKVFVVALLSFVAMYTYVCPLRHLVQALVVW